jgi:hypothetical protein
MEEYVQKFIMAFVTLLIGVILLGVTSDMVIANTGQTLVTNSTLSIASARNLTAAGNEVLASVKLYPQSSDGTIDVPKASTVVTDSFLLENNSYGVMLAGNYTTYYSGEGSLSYITLVNNSYWLNQHSSNTTYLTFKYYAVSPAWARTMQNLVPGFIALALFIVSVVLVMSAFKDMKQ